MKHSILLLLLTVFFLRPSIAQELGEDVDDLKLTTISPTKVRLTWTPFGPADSEASITYSVFRGTTETFIPSLRNRIARGLTRNSYVTAAPIPSKDYYYYVKAIVTPVSSESEAAPCHALVARLNGMVARFSPSQSDASLEQSLEQYSAYTNQLIHWMKQLEDCALNAPAQLTTKDWQNAVFINGELTAEFDRAGAAIESKIESKNGSIIVKTLDQQWLNDYNDLVHKYNDLVRDYNGQRDLIIRLIATPPPLPPARTFMHCSTFNFGTVGSIDCY